MHANRTDYQNRASLMLRTLQTNRFDKRKRKTKTKQISHWRSESHFMSLMLNKFDSFKHSCLTRNLKWMVSILESTVRYFSCSRPLHRWTEKKHFILIAYDDLQIFIRSRLLKKEYLQQCRLDSYSPVNVLSGSKVYTRNTLPIPLPSTMCDTENYDANNSSNGENNPVHQRKSLIILQILW